MSLSTVFVLAQKESRDALRNRWFLAFAACFAGLALALAWLGLSDVSGYEVSGFGRTSASLVNLVLLIVPLMGLLLGSLALASERERGTLLHLLAQPVSSLEVLLGKLLGLGTALVGTVALGFGAAGLVLAARGGLAQADAYLLLAGLACLLALASLGVGLAVSAAAERTATAVGVALALWLAFALLSDLGLMGLTVALRLEARSLFFLALANPLQDFKIAAVLSLRDNLETLGPAGEYAHRAYGAWLGWILAGALCLWVAASVGLAGALLRKKEGT